MNNELKNMIDRMYGICDTLDENSLGVAAIDPDKTTREALKTELITYLMYLAASDGKIAWEEAIFMRDYLGMDLTTDDIHQLITENQIYSTDFENSVPISMQLFVNLDNVLYDNQGYNESLASEFLFQLYDMLGKRFLACDDEVSENEVQDLAIYLNMLEEYIDREVKSKANTLTELENGQNTSESQKVEDEKSLEELLQSLNSLTGLEDVKKDVNSLINLLEIRKLREERGMKPMPISLHLVFSGNPGTGKTTVARLLAKIYCRLGVLSKGQLVEVDRSGLVGEYVGQTAIKVQEVIQKSLGGILFIDEAYSLTVNKGKNDFGLEAVDTLLKGMEDHRDDLVVIVAGYPDLMNKFLNSNPGLRSRFSKFINFVDYKPDELVKIFRNMCHDSGYNATDECMEYVQKYFKKRYMTRDINFANGRDVRNFFEMAIVNQANRLSSEVNISNEDLEQLVLSDVKNIIV